jgi:multicomponent Na+:H+ antiporter subunit G
MQTVIHAAGVILLLGGLFFFFIGTLGLLRFPDAVTRMHAAAKCDTLGVGLCLAGLAFFVGFNVTSFKLALIVVIVWGLSTPPPPHLIGQCRSTVQTPPKKRRTRVTQLFTLICFACAHRFRRPGGGA